MSNQEETRISILLAIGQLEQLRAKAAGIQRTLEILLEKTGK